jgi:tetratricopeptide (TPR) repeat protein
LVFPKQFLLADVYWRVNERAKAHLCLEESRQMLENAVRESPLDASRHALLGQIYAGLGRTDDAIREGKRAVELLPESKDALDGPVMTLILAQIYTMVGDLDSALPLLEHSLGTPGGITVSLLKLDPSWDRLRSDPRFQKIIKSFGVKEAKL